MIELIVAVGVTVAFGGVSTGVKSFAKRKIKEMNTTDAEVVK